MNAVDVLKYGHQTILSTLENVPESEWETAGVCGVWSVKDIIVHLASYEYVLIDISKTLTDGGATPYLDEFSKYDGTFNDGEVDKRKGNSTSDALAEFNDVQAQVMTMIENIPAETCRQTGTLPWYGEEYALDDLIAYMFYGHKREHAAEINVFKDQLER